MSQLNIRQEWQYYCQLFEYFLVTHDDHLRREIAKGIGRLHKAYQQEFQVNDLVTVSNEKYRVLAFDKKIKCYEIIHVRDEKRGKPSSLVHWGRLQMESGSEQLTLF